MNFRSVIWAPAAAAMLTLVGCGVSKGDGDKAPPKLKNSATASEFVSKADTGRSIFKDLDQTRSSFVKASGSRGFVAKVYQGVYENEKGVESSSTEKSYPDVRDVSNCEEAFDLFEKAYDRLKSEYETNYELLKDGSKAGGKLAREQGIELTKINDPEFAIAYQVKPQDQVEGVTASGKIGGGADGDQVRVAVSVDTKIDMAALFKSLSAAFGNMDDQGDEKEPALGSAGPDFGDGPDWENEPEWGNSSMGRGGPDWGSSGMFGRNVGPFDQTGELGENPPNFVSSNSINMEILANLEVKTVSMDLQSNTVIEADGKSSQSFVKMKTHVSAGETKEVVEDFFVETKGETAEVAKGSMSAKMLSPDAIRFEGSMTLNGQTQKMNQVIRRSNGVCSVTAE